MRSFDLIVLGTGVAGSAVATPCAKAGWSVAVVDPLPYGGTCQLRGCDPKRVLTGVAEIVDAARRLHGRGIVGDSRIDWRELIAFKRTFTEPVPAKREHELEQIGITTLHGTARFVGPRAIEVDGKRYQAGHFHLATGARPSDLPIEGAEHLTTSERFLDLDELPSTIAFVGAGMIGLELAHVAARAGAQVTIIEQSERPLPEFDRDLVGWLVERTRAMGIETHLGTTVERITKTAAGLVVHAGNDQGPVTVKADMVTHAAGRVANLDGLDLDAAGIAHDQRGVKVNEFMQSVSNPAVYAAGDVTHAGPQLTPIAGRQGRIAATNLLEGNHRKLDHPPIPSVLLTLPPLARIGMLESEARDAGVDVRVEQRQTSDWYSSRRIGEGHAGFKVLVGESDGRIVGAHLLGTGSDELINLFAVAMRGGLTARALKQTLFAYPTLASNLGSML